jgi:hypothetical protein
MTPAVGWWGAVFFFFVSSLYFSFQSMFFVYAQMTATLVLSRSSKVQGSEPRNGYNGYVLLTRLGPSSCCRACLMKYLPNCRKIREGASNCTHGHLPLKVRARYSQPITRDTVREVPFIAQSCASWFGSSPVTWPPGGGDKDLTARSWIGECLYIFPYRQ